MPNDVKRNQKLVVAIVDERRRRVPVHRTGARVHGDREITTAWLAAGGLLLALIGLLVLLPAPTELTTVSGQGAAAVDAAVLAGTALLVWALTGWVAIVLAVAAVGVLPGVCGRQARRLLAVIAPRLALRLVAVAVGASALAGTTACGAPIFASTAAPSSAVSVAGSEAVPPPGSEATAAATVAPVSQPVDASVVFDIDWPTSAPLPGAVVSEPASASVTDAPAVPSVDASSSAVPPGGTTTTTTPVTGSPATPDPGAADQESPAAAPGSITPPPVTRPSGEVVVVQPGDTLWALADDSLPAGADGSAIDAAWRQWYELNRGVIGDNPDLLEPGQHLIPPSADSPTAATSTPDQENDR